MNLTFIRSAIRKEWQILNQGLCIGHIWFCPSRRCYCLCMGGATTFHSIYGAARLAAIEHVSQLQPTAEEQRRAA